MNNLNKKLKASVVGLMLGLNLVYVPATALAEVPAIPEVPTIPTAPTAPTAPTSTYIIPEAPTAPPVTYVIPPVPTAPTTTTQSTAVGTAESTQTSPSSSTNSGNGSGSENTTNNTQNNSTEVVNVNDATVDNQVEVDVNTGQNEADKNGGSATINSGDAAVSGGLLTDINNNFITIGDLCGLGCSEAFVAENLKNGDGTLNNANGQLTNLVILNNRNNLNLTNTSFLGANTGYNSTNKNMGDGTIVSGDADVVFTTINFGNNNGINMSTSDYTIVDTKTDDLWINFPTGTASGSGLGLLGASNVGNGADSTNTANSSADSTFLIDNNNNLVLNNNVTLYANTGNNTSDKNMGTGDITTGDANIASNIINFLNNNIVAGAEWLLSTVNIFGDMSGDIILPGLADGTGSCGCPADLTAVNSGNGADSTNVANASSTDRVTINELNNAAIANNLNLDANTGGNNADENMGSASITTGNTDVNSNLVTVANTNSVGAGDTWWLVLVNNQGEWTGKIVGAEDGDTIAGSGLEFGISPNGMIQALNTGNGADSTNTANTSSNNTTTINNTNNATINNNINIEANTGDNSASQNMAGANIDTGDINVASNIVNFINNNFVGKKFVITIVNIFGKFTGNIVPPDQAIPSKAVGGQPLPAISLSGNQTISQHQTNKSTSGVGRAGSNNQTLAAALAAGAGFLGSSTKVAGSSTDGPITKVINQPKSSFNFNLILIAGAALVVVGYSLLARRKAS